MVVVFLVPLRRERGCHASTWSHSAHSAPTLSANILIYPCACICVCIYIYIHMRACISLSLYIYIYIYLFIYIYIYIYIYTHTHTHTRIHIHVYCTQMYRLFAYVEFMYWVLQRRHVFDHLLQICSHLSMHTRIHACMHAIYMRTDTRVCVCVWVRARIHACRRVYVHACVYTC